MKTASNTSGAELITDAVSDNIIEITEKLVTEKGAHSVTASSAFQTECFTTVFII